MGKSIIQTNWNVKLIHLNVLIRYWFLATIDTAIQRTVYNALMQGYQVEMDYLSPSSQFAKHYDSVHLQGLVQYGKVIYWVATINDYKDLRLCSLEYFDL